MGNPFGVHWQVMLEPPSRNVKDAVVATTEAYKLLAFVIALYFPVVMVTWAVVDRLSDGRVARTRPAQGQEDKTR